MKELIESNLRNMGSTYGIRVKAVKAIMILPLLTVLLFTLILMFPGTRLFGWEMIQENNLIELLTFLFLLIGGIKGMLLIGYLKKRVLNRYEVIFYTIFSLSLLLIAMEEIAWGQWFLGFDTPMFLKQINTQGETTLHNIQGLHGHSEIFRLIFGLGGTVGVFLSTYRPFQKIGAPFILLPYFIVVVAFASFDLYDDYYLTHIYIKYGNRAMSEVLEMIIGISSFLYIWLNARKIQNILEEEQIKGM